MKRLLLVLPLLVACTSTEGAPPSSDPSPARFSFGVIADVQYADKPDRGSRLYRGSLRHLEDAVEDLNGRGLAFTVQLGDIIDDRDTPDASRADLGRVLDRFARLDHPRKDVLGNHCFSVPRGELLESLGLERPWHSWTVGDYRFIALDTQHVSTNGWAPGTEPHAAGEAWLAANADLPNARPWNGAVGEEQLAWLEGELAASRAERQLVVVFTHAPLHPGASDEGIVAWDHGRVVETLIGSPNVVAVFSGHHHAGGYDLHRGVHFVTLQAMLDAKPDTNAYGVVEVQPRELILRGVGDVPSRVLSLMPRLVQGEILADDDLWGTALAPEPGDWLVDGAERPAVARRGERPDELVLENGLLRRTFRIEPNGATVAYDNLMTGESILRAVQPEARITLDGVEYEVGGLTGQPEHGYLLPEWIDDMQTDPGAFTCLGGGPERIETPIEWPRVRHAEDRPWPPPSAGLAFTYTAPPGPHEGVIVSVAYELYDGLPLLSKQLRVMNGTERPVRVDSFTADLLAAVEPESDVEVPERWELPGIHVETDYSCGGFTPKSANLAVRWIPDPDYTSQVNYARQTPNLLEVKPPLGPGIVLQPGETFDTFRTYHLVHDSTDRERRGLARKRMYRTMAPWVTENPILMHVRSSDPEAVRLAVDQCAEVGFEMVIMTFGSGFNIESTDPAYIAEIKGLVDYAHSKGVELGGYSLFSSRRISDEHDVVDPATGKPGGAKFGNAPCAGSAWGLAYFAQLRSFIEQTGLDLLEHDGPYPGDVCASTTHPGHEGLEDSQWRQFEISRDFYRWCRARGVYLNVPDWYFLNGSNKCGMGYRETNWSLPRERQVILGRQNIYDGTWIKTPSMGWMFVPLVEYHGGGAAATLEPLSEHLDAYGAHLANNFANGVQACYRGPRLYDTPATRDLVKGWVDFFLRFRPILEADVVHLRRADGRAWDATLHVDPRAPAGEPCAFLALFNPTDAPVDEVIEIPLEFAGLTEGARVFGEDGERTEVALDRAYRAHVRVRCAPRGFTWLAFERP